MKAREITLGAVLLACALTVFVVESYLPSFVPIPGFKIGLANVFTLVALYLWDAKHCFIILLLRIIIGSLIFGGGISFLYSFAGGMTCFVVMAAFKGFLGQDGIVIVSMTGAVFHNIGQLLIAAFILSTDVVFVYFPILCAVGIASGLFVGLVGRFCITNRHIGALFGGDI